MKAVVLDTMHPETDENVVLTVEEINISFVIIQLKQKGLPVLRAEVNVIELAEILSFLIKKPIHVM